jgi:E3 ubiquitin-protein ligase MYCBP2
MELAQSRNLPAVTTPIKAAESESESLSALACSCLISLVITRGDTGKLLTAIAAMLMFSARLAKQEIKVGWRLKC